jgi:hypothetical protein
MEKKKRIRVLSAEEKVKRTAAVKRWRNNSKQRMIDAMGGKCQICGYHNCNSALDFHHLDPTEKEFGFGGLRATIKGWDTLIQELRKCVLLCNRCHTELHNGVVSLPSTYEKFNEEYVEYKNMYKEQ